MREKTVSNSCGHADRVKSYFLLLISQPVQEQNHTFPTDRDGSTTSHQFLRRKCMSMILLFFAVVTHTDTGMPDTDLIMVVALEYILLTNEVIFFRGAHRSFSLPC